MKVRGHLHTSQCDTSVDSSGFGVVLVDFARGTFVERVRVAPQGFNSQCARSVASLKKGSAKHPSQKSHIAGAKASSHQPGTFQLTLVVRRREGASVARLEARLATRRGLPLSRARRLARRVSRWLEVSAARCALSRALRLGVGVQRERRGRRGSVSDVCSSGSVSAASVTRTTSSAAELCLSRIAIANQ